MRVSINAFCIQACADSDPSWGQAQSIAQCVETTPPRKTVRGGRLCCCHTCSVRSLHLFFVVYFCFNTSEIASELELSFHLNVYLNLKTIKSQYILQLKLSYI